MIDFTHIRDVLKYALTNPTNACDLTEAACKSIDLLIEAIDEGRVQIDHKVP